MDTIEAHHLTNVKIKHIAFIILLNISFSGGVAIAGGTYNPINASRYETTYSNDEDIDKNIVYNKNYYYFPDTDCTNFLSQAFRAGGLYNDATYEPIYSIDPYWGTLKIRGYELKFENIKNWFNFSPKAIAPSANTMSTTWIRAHDMYTRMKSGYDGWKYIGSKSLSSTNGYNINVELGDVIFAKWDLFSLNIKHAMMVTGFKKVGNNLYEPRLTYHSKNRLNIAFSKFKENSLNRNPYTTIYIFRRNLNSTIPPAWQVF